MIFSETTEPAEAKSYGVSQGKMKDYISDDQGHKTKMPLSLYVVKNFKTSSSAESNGRLH